MRCLILPVLFIFTSFTLFVGASSLGGNGEHHQDSLKTRIAKAEKLLDGYGTKGKALSNLQANAQWNYLVNLTNENQEKLDKLIIEKNDLVIKNVEEAKKISTKGFPPSLKRQIKLLQQIFISKNPEVRKKRINILSTTEKIYGEAKACLPDGKCLHDGEDGANKVFEKERNYDLLSYVWKSWSDASGKKLKSHFKDLVNILNIEAVENGYKNSGYAEWFTDFEMPDFDSKMVDVYNQLKPFYTQLHAYIRHKLSVHYPGKFDAGGLIPAHLFGNLWSQQWMGIFDLVVPFPDSKNLDITKRLKKLNSEGKINVKDFFTMSEKLFTSLGMHPMTKDFWMKSFPRKLNDTTMQCHGRAFDFYNGKDYRILMCPEINFEDFTTVHHEMGHVEYYMAYANQPFVFMGGSNSGFHEAVGDTMALAVTTKTHLKKIGLISSSDYDESEGSIINQLMFKALEKVAFLPFAFVVDDWRWKVFNGTITPHKYNSAWWEMNAKYRGIKPPMPRSDDDFDPGAKYHVAINVPYIRYFFSFVLQFQFYKSMCKESKWQGPLHDCDFYGSKEAGLKFEKMLQLGKSKPWPDALEMLTGERQLNVAPLLEYFDPLVKWLQQYNKKNKIPVGW